MLTKQKNKGLLLDNGTMQNLLSSFSGPKEVRVREVSPLWVIRDLKYWDKGEIKEIVLVLTQIMLPAAIPGCSFILAFKNRPGKRQGEMLGCDLP